MYIRYHGKHSFIFLVQLYIQILMFMSDVSIGNLSMISFPVWLRYCYGFGIIKFSPPLSGFLLTGASIQNCYPIPCANKCIRFLPNRPLTPTPIFPLLILPRLIHLQLPLECPPLW